MGFVPRVTTSEAEEQMAVIKWAELMSNKHTCLKWLYHCPNGGSRNVAEAANLKRMGVKAGVPDLCLPYPSNGHHGLYIEMKRDGGRLTAAQRDYLAWLNENGYRAVVCYGTEHAIKVLEYYLQGGRNERRLD